MAQRAGTGWVREKDNREKREYHVQTNAGRLMRKHSMGKVGRKDVLDCWDNKRKKGAEQDSNKEDKELQLGTS